MSVNFNGVGNDYPYARDLNTKDVSVKKGELNDYRKLVNGSKIDADTFEKLGKKKLDAKPKEYRKSSFGRKFGTALIGTFAPFCGQIANGQFMKAIGFAVGTPLLSAAAFCLNPALGVAVGAGMYIASIVDAYKNA